MFDALKKPILGRNGGLTVSDLEKETRRSRFSDYLPWTAYDRETCLYRNTDNSLGFIWECFPHVFAGEKEINTLKGLFGLSLPEGSILQFTLYADRNIDSFLRDFESSKTRRNDLVGQTTLKYMEFLRKGTEGIRKASGIPVRNFRVLISLKVPVGEGGSSVNFEEIRMTVHELLTGARLHPRLVAPEQLLDVARRLFNSSDTINRTAYDETLPIRKQVLLSETDVESGFGSIRFGRKHFRCTTPKLFPPSVSPISTNQLFGGIWGIASDSDQVKTPFLYTLNVVFENLKGRLHTKCNMVLQQQGVGSFAPSLARKQNEFMWAVDELEKGSNRFLRIIPIVWVFGKNQGEVTESLTRVKRMWESQGFLMQEDKGILNILLISALPFGLYNVGKNLDNLDRDFIAPAETISAMLPVQADFAGGGNPILPFIGRKGQLCSMDLFAKGASNYNAFVAATSGQGKSFLINSICFNYFGSGSMIRIIDIGGSYKKMTRMCGAVYMDFAEDSHICLNPFTNIMEPDKELSVVEAAIAQMVYSSQNREPEETEYSLIKTAVARAYKDKGKDADIDAVYRFLKNYPGSLAADRRQEERRAHDRRFKDKLAQTAHELAFNMRDFTSEGRYGKYFNGRSTFNIANDDFVVLELEHLKGQKDLFRVVTLLVINAVTQDLYLTSTKRNRLIIFDEAWQFMRDGDIIKSVIEEGYRRARKYGGSFTVVTQSILDLETFGSVGQVILANSAYRFLLASSDFERAKSVKLIDYADFEMDLLKSIRTNKGNYSEIFMDTPLGRGVVRHIVDPYSYYAFTSDPREIAEINALMEKHGCNYADAIRMMIEGDDAQGEGTGEAPSV